MDDLFSAFGPQHSKRILPKNTFGGNDVRNLPMTPKSEARFKDIRNFFMLVFVVRKERHLGRSYVCFLPSLSSGLRLYPAYLSSKNTFDWTHGIRLGSVHNNKNTRKKFHVGFRQSIAATSKTTRTRTYVVPQHRYHKHFSAAGAYESPSSLDVRPFIQSPRPAIPGQKIQLQTGHVSAFSQNDIHLITCSLLQNALHIHLSLDQNIEDYETCVRFLRKYAPPKPHVALFRRPPTQNQPQKSGTERDGSPLPSEKDTLTTYAFVSLDSFSILPST